jgi:hypothetical protein
MKSAPNAVALKRFALIRNMMGIIALKEKTVATALANISLTVRLAKVKVL